VRMEEWDEQGLEPLFGHQRQWLTDLLDRISSPEAASYALLEDQGARGAADTHRSETARRRFLVASELGLLDGRLERPGDGSPRLTARLIPWTSVHGLELVTVTALDDALRHRTTWRVRVREPRVDLDDAPSDDALLDFWRDCALRAGRPPVEPPPTTE
jgi:hypothetical protein